jgi:hypothetical protein
MLQAIESHVAVVEDLDRSQLMSTSLRKELSGDTEVKARALNKLYEAACMRNYMELLMLSNQLWCSAD